jgi:hypothetical protein
VGKFSRIVKAKFQKFRWWRISRWWNSKSATIFSDKTHSKYSIGLVTYVNRYDLHFKPLINQLTYLFSDTEINVAVNGYYDADIQEKYLEDIIAFTDKFPHVNLIKYKEGQSLSKLWNELVIHSSSPRTFIFNDDIKLAKGFRTQVESSGVLKEKVAIINASWSHFVITKDAVDEFGWFDERFPGVGYEDHDYEIRLQLKGFQVKSYSVKDLFNISYITTDFSWGANEKTIFNKYSGVNGDHYFAKWEFSDLEKDGYTFVRIVQGYAKLKPDMETPNFYPEIKS